VTANYALVARVTTSKGLCMQIKTLRLDANKGLSEINMTRLGQVVALFGPNGAGKTRLLDAVRAAIKEYADKRAERVSNGSEEGQLRSRIRSLHAVAQRSGDPNQAELVRNVQTDLHRLIQETWLPGCIFCDDPADASLGLKYEIPRVVNVPYVRTVHDNDSLMRAPLSQLAATVHAVRRMEDPQQLQETIVPLLCAAAQGAYSDLHPARNATHTHFWVRILDVAKQLIAELMKMQLGYDVTPMQEIVPTLNDRHLNTAELSPGQKAILVFVGYLLNGLLESLQESGAFQHVPSSANQPTHTLRDSIVLIDEPELHLHPSALVQVVHGLRELVGDNGQIWLATHATCLLPHLEIGEVRFVHGGSVTKPGIETPHKAFEALVGDEDAVAKYREFIQLPYAWAANKFAAECLLEPAVARFRDRDPQLAQITDAVAGAGEMHEPLRILDYGAGQGRLAVALKDTRDLESNVIYIPVEPCQELHDLIKTHAGTMLCEEGVLASVNDLGPWRGQVDVAVLCNVLHEIRPTEWMSTLTRIAASLSENGRLLIVEDQEIPVGELPNQSGYLIMSPEELGRLCGMAAAPKTHLHEEKRKRDRLTCVEIGKQEIGITDESVLAALEMLKKRTLADVRRHPC
jgi:energy-coupling factor transporter ATP-binding protein EcfA2